MNRFLTLFALLASPAFAQTAVVNGPGGTRKVALFSDQAATVPVAQVENQVVTLQELEKALADVHGAHHDATSAGGKDFRPVLDRLIGARLVALEAHEMGLDALPAVKEAVDKYAIGARREVLRKRLIKDVKPDMQDAERYFREAVREWKLRSLLIANAADVKEINDALKAGKPWDEVAAKAVAAKKAELSVSNDYLGMKSLLPQVAAAVENLFGGQVSDPFQVEHGFAIVKVDDIRYPEDAQARAEATARALDEAREKELGRAYDAMVKRD
ncbi:MAG TPA: peptidylprolyl isomerase, partial [Myxococcales bacterium]|nr:peptidylprolyl isomerase [Myxococcales bacterium]